MFIFPKNKNKNLLKFNMCEVDFGFYQKKKKKVK